MPWLEYPKIDLVLEGRNGVGWFTSMLFLSIGILTFLHFFIKKRQRWLSATSLLISGLLTGIGLDKIIRFHFVWSKDYSDNFLFNVASDGMILRYGIYVLTVCAFLAFILTLPLFFTGLEGSSRSPIVRYGLLLVLVLPALYFGIQNFTSEETIILDLAKAQIAKDYTQMNQALNEGSFDLVVQYTHPTVYRTLGGPDKLKEMLVQVRSQAQNISSEVLDVAALHQKGKQVQAIIQHSTTIRTNDGEEVTRGSSFAFSDNAGESWVFAGINGRSFQEMKSFFPEIFDELDYSVKPQE
jgi:hypothetical protein